MRILLITAALIITRICYGKSSNILSLEENSQNLSASYLEWVPFKVKEGVSLNKLLTTSDKMQREFLEVQEGFIRRELIQMFNSIFVDVVYWSSLEDAEGALINSKYSSSCASYFSMMDFSNQERELAVSQFHIVREYR